MANVVEAGVAAGGVGLANQETGGTVEPPSELRDQLVMGPLRLSKVTRGKLTIRALQVLIVVVLIGSWEWIGHGSKTETLIISTPWTVAKWIWHWMEGQYANGWDDLWSTMEGAGLGWLLGIVIGVGLAAALAASRWVRLFAAPFVSMLNALPKIALAPLFLLILGETLSARVYFVTSGIFFITFYNVFGGLRSIDPIYIRNARVLGARRWHTIRQVYVPAILGWVMTSLRLTAAWALAGEVIAEFLGGNKGMGVIAALGESTDDIPELLGAIIIVAVVAVIVDRIIVRVELRFSKWRLA